MNRKISLGLCLTLIILTVAATFSVTMLVSKRIYNRIISNLSQRSQVYSTMDEINRIVSNYYYGSVPDTGKISVYVAQGYVNGLNDGVSKVLTAEQYKAYQKKMNKSETGCGIEIYFDAENGKLLVAHVYDSSPAKKSGIEAGDVITSIDGEAVTAGNYKKLIQKLSGSLLSTVKIGYERGGESFSDTLSTGFSVPSCLGVLKAGVGYIKISGFYKKTADDFRTALTSLIESGAQSIVIDLRNTQDGTIDYAVETLDVVVPSISSNLAVARDKYGNVYKNKVYAAETQSISSTFAVIINAGTKGPAELFACDMRDICGARLVGETTAGVGTMQEVFTLENGGALLLNVAKIIPYAGEAAWYGGTGLTPDVKATLTGISEKEISPANFTKDSQIKAAFDILS
ncbi:MAG: PDZ domain-containing protein [Clostridiales bacterium]|nr:PDZ domain-containing protein [Clostridiales bacterium]